MIDSSTCQYQVAPGTAQICRFWMWGIVVTSGFSACFAFGCWKNMMSTQVDPGPNTLSLFIYEIIIKPNTHKLQTSRYINWKPGITFQPKIPSKKKWTDVPPSGHPFFTEVVNWWSRSWHIPFWRRCKWGQEMNPLQLPIRKTLDL